MQSPLTLSFIIKPFSTPLPTTNEIIMNASTVSESNWVLLFQNPTWQSRVCNLSLGCCWAVRVVLRLVELRYVPTLQNKLRSFIKNLGSVDFHLSWRFSYMFIFSSNYPHSLHQIVSTLYDVPSGSALFYFITLAWDIASVKVWAWSIAWALTLTMIRFCFTTNV